MPNRVSTGVGDHPCFLTFNTMILIDSKITNFSLCLYIYIITSLICQAEKKKTLSIIVLYQLSTFCRIFAHTSCVNLSVCIILFNRHYSVYLAMISLLLLVPSLLHSTTGSVYNVTPDDHYYPNPTCHHCHNLQHHLLNTTKYFSSNTQLFFLPGLHHLHTDLIIQNVYNISLISSTTNDTTPDTVIQCNSLVGIVLRNITNLEMKSITIKNCTRQHSYAFYADLQVEHCYNVHLAHIKIFGGSKLFKFGRCGVRAVNVLGSSIFTDITSNGIRVEYNRIDTQRKHHKLLIEDYHIVSDEDVCNNRVIELMMYQASYQVEFEIYSSNITQSKIKELFRAVLTDYHSGDLIHIRNCTITHISAERIFTFVNRISSPSKSIHHFVQFTACNFFHNVIESDAIKVLSGTIHMNLQNCIFKNNTAYSVLSYGSRTVNSLVISNTIFSDITCISPLVDLLYVVLQLRSPLIFTQVNISRDDPIISVHSDVEFYNYIEFSNSITTGKIFIEHFKFMRDTEKYFTINENTLINVSSNIYKTPTTTDDIKFSFYPPCYFQFTSDRGNLDDEFKNGSPLNYSIVISNDSSADYLEQAMIHCYWLPGSAFNTTSPYELYKRFVKTDQPPTHGRLLCYCTNDSYQDCHTHVLATIYPGQVIRATLALNKHYLHLTNGMIAKLDQNFDQPTACKVNNLDETEQSVYSYCFPTKYTIVQSKFTYLFHWCELFLRIQGLVFKGFYYNMFYITFLSCPHGFVQINGVCTCDPLLNSKLLSITTCDINHQTILRPANTWLTAITINNSHQYHISPHCPLQYCLPHALITTKLLHS